MEQQYRLEYYANELLKSIKNINNYDDYKNYQNITAEIEKAVQTEDKSKIHTQYPFLTDAFFHVVVAGIKAQAVWLDWLWMNEQKHMSPDDKKIIQKHLAAHCLEYKSMHEIIMSLMPTENSENMSPDPISANVEEIFQNNINDMKSYLNSEPDLDDVRQHIISAKLQLKFIDSGKRRGYINQYIALLKELNEKECIKQSSDLQEIIRFFVGKYEYIPINFCNDDECKLLADMCSGELLKNNNSFTEIFKMLNNAHREHELQSTKLKDIFADLRQCGSNELKFFAQCWGAICSAQVFRKIKSPDEKFYSCIEDGVKAQVLLYNMCAWSYYRINNFGSGKISAQHLDNRFDRTGQLINVNYQLDGTAMDMYTHILNNKMREYLDGEHSTKYLINIIDNTCKEVIDYITGAKRKYKAAGENKSLNRTSKTIHGEDKKTSEIDDLIDPDETLFDSESGKIILNLIRKKYFQLYLYLLLWYYGVKEDTLKELQLLPKWREMEILKRIERAEGAQKQVLLDKLEKVKLKNEQLTDYINKLTLDQDLNTQEKLECIGKKGNGHFFIRELKKMYKDPDFHQTADFEDILEIIRKICQNTKEK